MSSEEGKVYMIRDQGSGDDEWVSPEPADDVILDAVLEATDLAAEDLDDLGSYVDFDDLAAVLDSDDGTLSFDVEGHEVTVTGAGDVSVAGD